MKRFSYLLCVILFFVSTASLAVTPTGVINLIATQKAKAIVASFCYGFPMSGAADAAGCIGLAYPHTTYTGSINLKKYQPFFHLLDTMNPIPIPKSDIAPNCLTTITAPSSLTVSMHVNEHGDLVPHISCTNVTAQ